MEFMDVGKKRYSCKNFGATQITKEQLDVILEAGRLAPTAKNNQEQHVYVIQSKESLAKVDGLTPCRYGAPTMLLVAFDKTNTFTYPGQKYDSGIEDASIVATHMMLQAADLGVHSTWVNMFNPDETRKAFNLPENEVPVLLMMFGYPTASAAPAPTHTNKKTLSDTVQFL